MTNIGRYISELIQVWRARCGGCGITQIVTTTYKADAEHILKTMLGWTYKTATGWRCRNCNEGQPNQSEWTPENMSQESGSKDPIRWDMDH